LDTKGEEARYVKDYIEKCGHQAMVIDCGILGEPLFEPEIGRGEVAEAASVALSTVTGLGDEGKAIEVMARGAALIAQRLCVEGRIDGIIAIGGSMGTSLALPVMKGLPFGLPKLVVSTIAFSSYITSDALSVDMVMVQSPADMWGLNSIIRMTLSNAAAAITAMAEVYRGRYKSGWVTERSLIGMTTLGTAVCRFVPYLNEALEKRGYEVAVFHVPGMGSLGSRALVELVEQGLVAGVLDLAQMDLLDGVCRGLDEANLNRIDVAVAHGIPLVIAPGCLHSFTWNGPPATIPGEYQGRPIHQHNPLIAAIKATPEEMAAAGRLIAEKANKAKGPVAIVIPKSGFSEWDRPGTFFHDPEAEMLFAEHLKKTAQSQVRVVEVDAHINDTAFSDEVLSIFDDMMKLHPAGRR
jgi:uncharacterized protein (UPF0261 family)